MGGYNGIDFCAYSYFRGPTLSLSFFSVRIYFTRILKLNLRNFKNKHKAEILKRV